MKKFLFLTLAVLMLVPVSSFAQKAKKPKKEKKEFEWKLPEQLSGNEDFDKYLLSCDTVWNRITEYGENLQKFSYVNDTLYAGGKFYQMAYMLNEEGKIVTKGQVGWELANAIMQATNLTLDITNIALLTTSATLALPSLGLKTLTFGPFLKLGPKVLDKGKDEMGEIIKKRKAQMAQWRALKQEALTKEQVAGLGIFNEDGLKKIEKCIFVKEIDTEETHTYLEEHKEAFSDEEKYNQFLAATAIAPEDENKMLKEDDDLDKYL